LEDAIKNLYRKYIKEDFPNSREMENPSVFLEAVRQQMLHCGETGSYLQLFLKSEERRLTDITYLCSCEPATNVVVEVLCDLVRGMPLEGAENLTEEPFYQIIGSREETIGMTVRGVLALLREGIARLS